MQAVGRGVKFNLAQRKRLVQIKDQPRPVARELPKSQRLQCGGIGHNIRSKPVPVERWKIYHQAPGIIQREHPKRAWLIERDRRDNPEPIGHEFRFAGDYAHLRRALGM